MPNKDEENVDDGGLGCDLSIHKQNAKTKNRLNYDNILDHIGQLGRYTFISIYYS